LIDELGWKEHAREESRSRAQEHAEGIPAFENHRETGGQNSQTRKDDGRQYEEEKREQKIPAIMNIKKQPTEQQV
jgi:hypothetical protein